MIKPDKDRFFNSFLNQYLQFIVKKNFRKLVVKELPDLNADKSTLVVGNHFSWWDGILVNEINKRHLKKDFYVLMLEEQLSKNKILRKAGALSIDKNSKSMIESFNFCKSILKKKETLLLFYPQGEIESMHKETVTFQKGLTRLLDQTVELLFYTCLPDYFSNSKPDLYFYFQTCPFSQQTSVEEIQGLYNDFYKESRLKQSLKKL